VNDFLENTDWTRVRLPPAPQGKYIEFKTK